VILSSHNLRQSKPKHLDSKTEEKKGDMNGKRQTTSHEGFGITIKT